MKMENTRYRFSRSPQTFSFKALMNTVSCSATMKCSSSLVSMGRILPHVGDFSLDTQRVEVYSSFMVLTKSSAFWKLSSVSLSSLEQKMKYEDKNKKTTIATHCFTTELFFYYLSFSIGFLSRWSSDAAWMSGYCSKNLSTIKKREFHRVLTSRTMLCCCRSETQMQILNYNLLKMMFDTNTTF